MKKTHVHVDPADPVTFPDARVDEGRLDATSDEMIDEQIQRDDAEAMEEMGNWEQGRRYPTATARALLKVVDRSPEAALAALRASR